MTTPFPPQDAVHDLLDFMWTSSSGLESWIWYEKTSLAEQVFIVAGIVAV